MTDPARHDWPRIIAELERHGTSTYKLALLCHVDRKTTRRWSLGQGEPGHFAGEIILALHAELGEKRPIGASANA